MSRIRLPLLPRTALAGCIISFGLLTAQGDDQTAATPPDAKAALARFNELIGGWRGTGQIRRGSNQGAWREDAEWIWEFEGEAVSIRYDVTDGLHLKSAKLTWDADANQFVLEATLPDDAQRTYRGTFQDDKLVLESPADDRGDVHRLTVTLLNEKRTLVLFEKRRETQQSYQRVAEVGYTREGTRLAFKDGTGPECVVTGGAGTIQVSFKGQTYYVCCTGCQQAFEDDPEGVLAEYAARLEKEKAEREQAE
jgi:YHS domain-containing protein